MSWYLFNSYCPDVTTLKGVLLLRGSFEGVKSSETQGGVDFPVRTSLLPPFVFFSGIYPVLVGGRDVHVLTIISKQVLAREKNYSMNKRLSLLSYGSVCGSALEKKFYF